MKLENSQIEMIVLGAMLIDDDSRAELMDICTPDMFVADPKHRVIFEYITKTHNALKPVNCVTVSDAISKAAPINKIEFSYLSLCVDEHANYPHTESYSVNGLVEMLKEGWRLRCIAQISKELALKASQARPAAEIALEYVPRLNALADAVKVDYTGMGDDMVSATEYLEAQKAARESGKELVEFTWGVPVLDDLIQIARGKFIVVGAWSGHGKTSLALNAMAANARKGIMGAFQSLEMSQREIATNVLANLYDFDARGARRGYITADTLQKLKAAEKDIRALSGVWTAPSGVSVNDIRVLTRKAVTKYNVGYCIYDYLQLVNSDGKSDQEKIANISRCLKEMAREFNIAVIALSQLSNPNEKIVRRPNRYDLRGSGQIYEMANDVVLLYRRYKDIKRDRFKTDADYLAEKKKWENILEFIAIKSKDADDAYRSLYFDAPKFRITELARQPEICDNDDEQQEKWYQR